MMTNYVTSHSNVQSTLSQRRLAAAIVACLIVAARGPQPTGAEPPSANDLS